MPVGSPSKQTIATEKYMKKAGWISKSYKLRKEVVKPYLPEIEKWCNTMTEAQICKRLGVGKSAWNEYKKRFPELMESIKRGRTDLVSDLKSALIRKAKGYEYTETKITRKKVELSDLMKQALIKAGFEKEALERVDLVKTEISHKKASPDVAAINLLLKNYDKENWANDPQMLQIRQEELRLREKQVESNTW